MMWLPDEITIRRFRHLLEAHDLSNKMFAIVSDLLSAKGPMLKTGTAVDATFISAPNSSKNAGGERDPEMHSTQKSGNWYFGMKAHVGTESSKSFCFTR